MRLLQFGCAAALMMFSSTAGAATIGFTGLPQEGQSFVVTENGIRVVAMGAPLGYFEWPGTAHLDDLGAPFPHAITFTIPNSRFTAESVDILGLGTAYSPSTGELPGLPYENVRWQGSRKGKIVASTSFYAGDEGSLSTYLFEKAFKNIDTLTVAALLPNFASNSCFDFPCGHFSIDNVTLAAHPSPVPLPAAAPLFAFAVAGAGLIGWCKRRGRPKPVAL